MSAPCPKCRRLGCMCRLFDRKISPDDWARFFSPASTPRLAGPNPAPQQQRSFAANGIGNSMKLPSQPIPLTSPQYQQQVPLPAGQLHQQQQGHQANRHRPVCPHEALDPAYRCREKQCPNYHPNTICKYFLQGNCRDADLCGYSHALPDHDPRDSGGAQRATQVIRMPQQQQRANSCSPSMHSSASSKQQALYDTPVPRALSGSVALLHASGARAQDSVRRAHDDGAVTSAARTMQREYDPTAALRHSQSSGAAGGGMYHDARGHPDFSSARPGARNLTSPSQDYLQGGATPRGAMAFSGQADRFGQGTQQRWQASSAQEAQYYQMLEYGIPSRVVSRCTEFVPEVDPDKIAQHLEMFSRSRNGRGLHAVRVCVMQQTYNFVKRKEAYARDPARDVFHRNHPLHPATSSRIVRYAELSKQVNEKGNWRYYPSLPDVVSRDCVEIACEMKAKGLNPLMLNMASATSPGGGFLVGDGAQEENLHRRSNYYQATNSLEVDERSHARYPLPDDGGLYSSAITFFRGTEARGYPFLDESTSIACIAVAALRHPKLSTDLKGFRYRGFESAEDREWMRRKIEVIYAAAVAHGHDALVLGAFGCGAFRCPAAEVAHLIASVHQLYGGYLRCSVVAILEDHNAVTDVNPDGLLVPFRDVFTEYKVVNEKKRR